MHPGAVFSLLLALWAASPVSSRPTPSWAGDSNSRGGSGSNSDRDRPGQWDGGVMERQISLTLQRQLLKHLDLKKCVEGRLSVSWSPLSAHDIPRREWNDAFLHCRSCKGYSPTFLLQPEGPVEFVRYRPSNDPALSAPSSSAFARAESSLAHSWTRFAHVLERERVRAHHSNQKDAAGVGAGVGVLGGGAGGGASAPLKTGAWLQKAAQQGEMCTDGLKLSPPDPFASPAINEDGTDIGMGEEYVEVYDHDAETGFATFSVHTACLSITERLFERRRRQGPGNASGGERGPKPTSPGDLYDAINRQSRDSQIPNTTYFSVDWPHGCYGAQACQGNDCEWMQKSWMCADPLGTFDPIDPRDVPDMTAFILAHLQPVTEREDEEEAAAASNKPSPSPCPPPSPLERLSIELLYHMTSYLPFADTLTLARTSTRLHRRLLTQRWWRDALVAGDVVGFLWDLNPARCRAKDREAHATSKAWDWRALAHQLAVRDCFDSGHAFHDAPWPLRNRQRIWKIVVDVGL
ncbi:MAG: hypothetical protein M1826_000130 [Phylliscum demangeonii]|nr:MAG: hypothetical protein M1826_000130 [Phylliscum demangeonii]